MPILDQKYIYFFETMKTLLLGAVLCLSVTSHAQTLNGTWKGELKAGPQTLTIVLNIDEMAQNVTMDVVEQSVKGLPMEVGMLTADSINVSIAKMDINYAGRRAAGKIFGQYRQGAFSAYLNFEPGEVKLNRPQEPQKPYPYETMELRFPGGAQDVRLAGTLTLPVGYKKGDKPRVVVMVTGSGAQNRNEEVFGHRPFLVLADWLARHGIASLRYDDRGVASSTGNQKEATTLDFTADAEAAIAYLRSLKQFSKIGVLGHSEGGMIAFLLGERKKPDFIVSMAGPAGRIDHLMMHQFNLLAKAQGAPNDVVSTPAEAKQMLLNKQNTPWTRHFIDMDIEPYVLATKCPVLALGGETDLNVPPSVNTPILKRALKKNKRALVKDYPELSHLFHHNPTGNPILAASIEETISPEVLQDISDWINGL